MRLRIIAAGLLVALAVAVTGCGDGGDFSFTEDHDVSQPIYIVEMDGEGGFELVEQVDPAE